MTDRRGQTDALWSPPVATLEMERDDDIDLAHLLHLLAAGKWRILACVLFALACASLYLFSAQPVYRADAMLQLQTQGNSALKGLMGLQQLSTGAYIVASQTEPYIIESRSVLGAVVRKLGLDVQARANYFPVVGESIAKISGADPAAEAFAPATQGSWWSHYAWRPASIDVRRFIVPRSLYGRSFTLRALGAGQYLLFGPHGNQVLQGRVGAVAEGKTADGMEVKLFVAGLHAAVPPTDFTVRRNPWLPVTERLKARLSVAGIGEVTGVIGISLEGDDPAHITSIVNAVAQAYLRQNVEVRTKQAQQSLAFLDQQLPELQAELQSAENKLASYREQHQAIGLDAESQALLNQVVDIEKQRAQLKLQLAKMSQLYTSEHPKLQAIHDQLQSLEETRGQLEKKIGTLPASQKSILRLRRNVEVNTQLYTALLNR
ncbi:MAG: Wzz/FepE/Etk N-terminal domain-containing protein, partial [Salinisphaera sp.]|nr:Wzz/FepE/Etk N-terminal domain-containing protein [Salinisphaera sp.]